MVSSRASDRFKGGQVAALALWIAGWSLLVGQSCGPPSPIQYVYDANGRLVAVVDPSQDSSGGGTAVYNYDGAGNLLSISRQQTTALFVLSFSPGCGTAGSPGTTVNIYGTGFTTSSTVKFNGVPAGSVTFVSATQLTATVPPSGASTGPITVSGVSNPNLGSFMVGCGAPTITSFTTCSGQTCSSTTPNCCIGAGATPTTGGTAVTITGTNFDQTASNDRLTFYHNRLASVGTPTMQQILTTAPANVTSGKLQLTTAEGLAVSALDFFAPPPSYTVADIDPNQAVRLPNPSAAGVPQ